MQTKFIQRAMTGAVAAAAMLIAGAAQASLVARDLNGDTVTDAFYDSDLNITWLRDANVNGRMNWATAVSWADGFSFGGYSDWRLPTSDTCEDFNCTGSEMGHLWYVELGNLAGGPMTNAGDFQNLQATHYWSGTEYALFPGNAWFFDISTGDQFVSVRFGISGGNQLMLAMAVRPGDVTVAGVPEPQTYALVLMGLSAMVLARRRQRR